MMTQIEPQVQKSHLSQTLTNVSEFVMRMNKDPFIHPSTDYTAHPPELQGSNQVLTNSQYLTNPRQLTVAT